VPRKRYADPALLLKAVIEGLQGDDDRRCSAAVLSLLGSGPLLCMDAALRQLTEPSSEVVQWRNVLLKFLRTLVREEGRIAGAPLRIEQPITFSAQLKRGQVTVLADTDAVRDAVVLQFVLLLHAVGLHNIRECVADDCQRLFVKTYRRLFCSLRCQKRILMRRKRDRDRLEEAQLSVRRARRRKET
jgi:hypothetical protein